MNIGLPSCYVDIYPSEGGPFTFSGSSVLQCQVEKHIWGSGDGSFDIVVAPGGPYGPNANPSWRDVITQMSLCVIGMQRAGRAHIVMVGVVRAVTESKRWTHNGVTRILQIHGQDFGYFFSFPNYYGQVILNYSAGAASLGATGALNSAMGLGVQNLTLSEATNSWWQLMTKLMGKTNFMYAGNRIPWAKLFGTEFGSYPGLPVEIPVGENFAVMQGSWYESFRRLNPHPWFEFFVTTAESGAYGQSNTASPITISAQGFPSASPVVIARPMPLPALVSPSNLQLSMDLWNALPVNQLDDNPINERLTFDDVDARNFYITVPTPIGTLFGASNASLIPFAYTYGSWIDEASLERYGFRPEVSNVSWWVDVTGQQAQKNAKNTTGFDEAVGIITLKSASFYEPAPLMATGDIVTNLRPDILPGTGIQFVPDKSADVWDAYIEGVRHTFTFGGESLTSMSIRRAMPDSVYQDSGLMLNVLQGNAQRIGGQWQSGLPSGSGPSLKALNLNTAPALLSGLSDVYNTPGAK